MGRMKGSEGDADAPLKGHKHHASEGPIKNRSCTDIICLVLFILTWIGMLAIAIISFTRGDPQRLLHGVDSGGRRCGFSPGVEDRPFLHFFDISRCASSLTSAVLNGRLTCNTPQVCVKACPSANALGFSGPAGQSSSLYCRDGRTLASAQSVGTPAFLKLVLNSTCAPYYLHSEAILGRCIPLLSVLADTARVLTDPNNNTLTDAGSSNIIGSTVFRSVRAISSWFNVRSIAVKVWEDFQKTYGWTLGSFAIIIIVCFAYILLISAIIGPLVYFSMFAASALLVYGTYICFDRYVQLRDGLLVQPVSANSLLDEYRYQTDTFLALGIIAAIGVAVMLFIIIFMIGRIRVAVAVIKETTKAMFAIKTSFLFPIFPALLQCALFSYFVVVGLFLVTSSKELFSVSLTTANRTDNVSVAMPDNSTMVLESGKACLPNNASFAAVAGVADCVFSGYDEDKILLGFQIFHIIGWLWTANWISALGQCVLAGAFASFYWTQKTKSLPTFPIFAALGRTLLYHSGSLAFGAAIITIVQIIRVALAYAERKLKKHTENPAVKYILKCVACLFYCLEKFLKFINKNAYIEIAVYGHNFCQAAKTAFSLLLRNVLRAAVLNNITSFILLLGKLLITLTVGIGAYFLFSHLNTQLDLHYFLAPVMVLMFAAFVLASVFLDTYDMGVDTIFLCALEDLERHDGSPGSPYYMSKRLQKVLNVKNKDAVPMVEK